MPTHISIIVPVYNVEKYLHKCISSILVQSFKDFELILVDDGSTDESPRICDDYAGYDNRIKVIHKANGGLSSARNCGLDISSGEYIGFVDSDDYIHRNMYEILYKSAVRNSSDIVVCDFLRVYENNKNTEVIVDGVGEKHFTNIEALEELCKESRITFTTTWNKLYKRHLFMKLKFADGRLHEDEFIAHKILYKSEKTTYVPTPLYFYLQRNDSIMKSKFSIKRLDAVYALKDRVDFFRSIKQQQLRHKTEYFYVEKFFEFYNRAKAELIGTEKPLKDLRKVFIEDLVLLMGNPLYNWKEKMLWLLFGINPVFYNIYNKKKSSKPVMERK